MIKYKPDIVAVDRMFMIALESPVETPEIRVSYPDSMVLFDRTPLPAKTASRKYYFRALRPAAEASIVFAHPDGPQAVSIEIWSFEDLRAFRTLKGQQLPRRWPLGEMLPELKTGQTTTTDKLKAYWRDRSARGKQYLTMGDDAIWSLQPDSTIPRWHWVNCALGCPVHGKEIYTHGAFYPWRNEKGGTLRSYTASVPYPWKIKCPAGGELYPSNDFAAGDMTSGDFPDDGIGGACSHGEAQYGFIAEICQSYCHQMLAVAPACADGYLATGDIRYVHKALVAMSRLAVEYAYLATMTHHRHRNSRRQVGRLGQSTFSEGPCLPSSGFTVYCIDQPGYQAAHAEAYDKIWPAIEQAPEIIPFLQRQGVSVETHAELRRFLEENLFAVWMQGAMDGATHSNEPYAQHGLVRMAEMLNYERGDEFMDWLYDGSGNMRIFVPNGFFRDGAPYESTGGYNGMHVVALGPIVEAIENLRELRPDVYPEAKYPSLSKSRRYHSVFDFSMNTVNIDRTFPRVGDSGAHPTYRRLGKRAWQNGGTAAFEHAYRVFRDPKFAWALVNTPGWRPSLEFPYTREQVEAEAATWPDDWNDASCLQDGYGLAMLRSGEGSSKRALWMMYGRARGHVHDDIMHIGLDADGSEILGHMGYPRNWNHWEGNWITQIQARQMPFAQMTAAVQLFADAGPVHVAEARAEKFSDKVASGDGYLVDPDYWQRRMLVLVDVDAENFYCLDLYRIYGGSEHWWTFHAQEGKVSTAGIQFEAQAAGTLAGPEVPYGDDKWLKDHGCRKGIYGWSGAMFGFPHLYNVQRGVPQGAWSADWELKGAGGLHFRLTLADSSESEAVLCDGTSPAGGKPYEMKWALLHKQGRAPVKSQVASLMELYRGEPVVRSVRQLDLTGEDEAGLSAYGLVIELEERTDFVFAAADASVLRRAPGGFEFAGRFGLYSERDGAPLHMVLIGGTRLAKNGIGIQQASAEYRARIVAVDRETETVTVTPAPADARILEGKYVYLTNAVRRLAYPVVEAKLTDQGAELRLGFDSRVGTGKVSGVEGHRVCTATSFYLHRFRYYHGARLVSADRGTEYRLAGVLSTKFALIDSGLYPDIDDAKLAAEFPRGSWFDIYDYGVGDEVVYPNVVSVSRF